MVCGQMVCGVTVCGGSRIAVQEQDQAARYSTGRRGFTMKRKNF